MPTVIWVGRRSTIGIGCRTGSRTTIMGHLRAGAAEDTPTDAERIEPRWRRRRVLATAQPENHDLFRKPVPTFRDRALKSRTFSADRKTMRIVIFATAVLLSGAALADSVRHLSVPERFWGTWVPAGEQCSDS